MFTRPGSHYSHGLGSQVYAYFGAWIGIDCRKKPGEELLAHLYRQKAVVKCIVSENVGEKTRYHRTETGTGDGPGGMFAAGAASEITSAHEYPPFETGIVHRKSGSETAILVITPVTEQVFTEALARSGFKKTRRYYLIGIYVFHLYRYCGRSKYCKFLCHIFFIKRVAPAVFFTSVFICRSAGDISPAEHLSKYPGKPAFFTHIHCFPGSVTTPLTAAAAATRGPASIVRAPGP